MFKPHVNNCIECGNKTLIVVKKLFCARCNHAHKQAKKKAENKPIKKHWSMKQPTGEKDLFFTIWAESNQRCFVCDKPIQYPIASNFMHVLPKALNKYPLFKLKRENVVLGCHDNESSCHHRFDKMPRSSLTEPMWKPLFELEARLKEEYINFKLERNKDLLK